MIKVNLITDWSKGCRTVEKEVEMVIIPRKGDCIDILEWFDESEFPDECNDCLSLFEVDYLVIRETVVDVYVIALDTACSTIGERNKQNE